MNLTASFIRTRIAPTPSGFLHLGNILSFVITVALARKAGAVVLLRIDDLDRERYDKKYVQDIFDTLSFLDIPWDEGPRNIYEYEHEYSQVHRLPFYQKELDKLQQQGVLFLCDCTRSMLAAHTNGVYPGTCRTKEISFSTDNVKWRMLTDNRVLHMHTLGVMVYNALPASVQDFIVRKKDGFPAYQLASVCDDLYFGVDCIVRGKDLKDSSWAQLFLADAMGDNSFSNCYFHHHGLLMENEHTKLSKSAGATSIQYLRSQHASPADIYSMIAAKAGIHQKVSNWQALANLLLTF